MHYRIIAATIALLALAGLNNFACSFENTDTPIEDSAASANVAELPTEATHEAAIETVPTSFNDNGQRSLEKFGKCINHYHRELRFAPYDSKIVIEGHTWGEFGNSTAWVGNQGEWQRTLPIALCLNHAPQTSKDQLSAKCVVQTAKWYLREHPDIEYAMGPFALIAGLPKYEAD